MPAGTAFTLIISVKLHKMDIVIPLGTGSGWQDNELRYCLRSIVKHLHGFRTIYIIGHKPAWLQNVQHIPFTDALLAPWKEKNICDKVLAACSIDGLSKQFMFFNDDHFLLQDVAAASMPFYHCGPAQKKMDIIYEYNPYRETVMNTMHLLGKDALNYDVHCPMILDRMRFPAAMCLVNWNKHYGYLMKTVYCAISKAEGTFIDDLKIDEALTPDAIQARIAGRPFFSIGNAALNDGMKTFLQQLYPDPCVYEKSK